MTPHNNTYQHFHKPVKNCKLCAEFKDLVTYENKLIMSGDQLKAFPLQMFCDERF